jgi:hypothetical protein
MYCKFLISLLPLPLIALGHPSSISARAPAKPRPCTPINPAPSEEQTRVRFNDFANAFIVTKNITHAFEYISQGYIVRNSSLGIGSSNLPLVWKTAHGLILQCPLLEHLLSD